MEIFGGFMVMMSIIGLFLAVIWLIMPFVVFAIKGKQDRMLEVLESIEKRLAAIENSIHPVAPERQQTCSADHSTTSPESSDEHTIEHAIEHTVTLTGSVAEKNSPETSPAA
jgi:hypothetical protein